MKSNNEFLSVEWIAKNSNETRRNKSIAIYSCQSALYINIIYIYFYEKFIYNTIDSFCVFPASYVS